MIMLYQYDPVFIIVQRTTYRQMNVSQIADASAAIKDVKQYQGGTRTIRHCGWHTKTAAAASLSLFVYPPLTNFPSYQIYHYCTLRLQYSSSENERRQQKPGLASVYGKIAPRSDGRQSLHIARSRILV
jgi:hypothetical protein